MGTHEVQTANGDSFAFGAGFAAGVSGCALAIATVALAKSILPAQTTTQAHARDAVCVCDV